MKTDFQFFAMEVQNHVATIYLNKPKKRNAMDWDFWKELPEVVSEIDNDPEIRAFIFAAKGKSFSTGLDISDFTTRFKDTITGTDATDRKKFYHLIQRMQSGINAVYNSNKPSIAVIHRHCIGGALDLISACDMRYCSADASFSLREVKVAIVADMGSINRLPAIIGDGNTRELALTGKDIDSAEALRMGLVSKVCPSLEDTLAYATKIAEEMAENPTFVTEGVKEVMRFCEGKPLDAGLNYVCVWNSSFLASKEFKHAVESFEKRKKPQYNQ
ncbi:MAG: crotonase/enoyl-CoA hydratase family protein [Spirochaetota bacterium]